MGHYYYIQHLLLRPPDILFQPVRIFEDCGANFKNRLFLKLALQLRQSTGEKPALINEAFSKCICILKNPL